MKILLDEDLPEMLRLQIIGHEVFTARYVRLLGISNGELLRMAAEQGFDVLVTGDRGMQYQQNLQAIPLSVVALQTHPAKLEQYSRLIPKLLDALAELPARTFLMIR